MVHGENETTDAFANTLRNEYGLDTFAPYSGTVFNLETGTFEHIAEAVPYVKPETVPESGPFGRLKSAGDRLNAVIERCRKMSNKDLAKFADQIIALADKWEP